MKVYVQICYWLLQMEGVKKISGPNGMCDIALAVMPETFIDDKHL